MEYRRPVCAAYLSAATNTSLTFQRVLIGTSESRSSSSGVCSETAKVTGIPSSINFSIPLTNPTVESVTERALIPNPSGVGAVMFLIVRITAL